MIARNIQRGRDHGIGFYTDYRKFCGFKPLIDDWDEKPEEISTENWNKFRDVYDSPLDIELFSGGIAEKPEKGVLVGPTFACLISYQFYSIDEQEDKSKFFI